MRLLVDFGNSYCKWALENSDGNLQMIGFEYAAKEIEQRVEEVIQAITQQEVSQIHAVSVLGAEFDDTFVKKLKEQNSCSVEFYASQKEAFGVKLSYDNVQTYGVDRYSALVAAHHKVKGDKLVIDCGTATTLDMIDARGVHMGGLIMPGANLMIKSLSDKATGIPSSERAGDVSLLSDDTENAVYSGCVSMMQYGLYGVIEQLTNNIQSEITLVITGGASHLLTHIPSNVNCERRPHLVLEGLQIMQS